LAFVVAAALVCHNYVPVTASTIPQLAFSEIVARAEVIVRGRVVGLRSYRDVASAARAIREKESVLPQASSAEASAAAAERPVAAGVGAGGRMIFTAVDIEVADAMKGGGASIVQFTIAGGTVDGRTARVFGMPTFQANEDVMLFLRQGYRRAGDPVVGVNQGAFRIVNEGGGEMMLDADSNYVIGVENDRVVTRRNPRAATASAHRVPTLLGAPTPDAGDVAASASREAYRFWTSQEPAMEFAAFKDAVGARLKR
jgi:hypothetical protein